MLENNPELKVLLFKYVQQTAKVLVESEKHFAHKDMTIKQRMDYTVMFLAAINVLHTVVERDVHYLMDTRMLRAALDTVHSVVAACLVEDSESINFLYRSCIQHMEQMK